MKRRALLLAGIAGTALLAGCAGQTIAGDAQDVQLVTTALQGFVADISVLPQVKGTPALTTIQTVLGDAAKLAGSLTTAPDTKTAQAFIGDVETIVATAQTLPGLPPAVLTGLTAASILLPAIASAYNAIVPASLARASMTPAEARQILQARAGR